MPPSAGVSKAPAKKGPSSASILGGATATGKDLTFTFSSDQKNAIKEWLSLGITVLEQSQKYGNDLLHSGSSNSNGFSSSNISGFGAAGGFAANQGGSSFQINNIGKDLKDANFQIDAILAEKGSKNEEQYEQLAVRILVRVILALGTTFYTSSFVLTLTLI